MTNDIREVLFTEEELKAMVKELGKKITEDYKGKNLFLITVLKGASVFMADLMRAIDLPVEIEFMVLSSYGSGTTSTGSVKIIKDIDLPLEGKDVLIVEDILDSGVTLSHLIELLKTRNPASMRLVTLFDKPERRKAHVDIDYCGIQVPDAFIVGYGLDYDEKYRNLPDVSILKPEVYTK